MDLTKFLHAYPDTVRDESFGVRCDLGCFLANEKIVLLSDLTQIHQRRSLALLGNCHQVPRLEESLTQVLELVVKTQGLGLGTDLEAEFDCFADERLGNVWGLGSLGDDEHQFGDSQVA